MRKNLRKMICVILVTILLMSACIFQSSSVYAAKRYIWNGIGGAESEYEYNPGEVLAWYAVFSTQQDLIPGFYIEDTQGYACYDYDKDGNFLTTSDIGFRDGVINAADSSMFLRMSLNAIGKDYNEDGTLTEEASGRQNAIEYEDDYIQVTEERYRAVINSMVLSLVKGLQEDGIDIDSNEVTYILKLRRPAVEELNLPAKEVEVNNKDKTVSTQYQELKAFMKEDKAIQTTYYDPSEVVVSYTTSVTLETENNGTYKLALVKRDGEDGIDKWYFEIVPDFNTNLTYESEPTGVVNSSGVYIVNDKVDVTAIITSENEEEIARVDGEVVSTTPTSNGWYYPEEGNKRKVAKIYKYDETKETVEETVELEGALTHKIDKQTPSILWTTRIPMTSTTEFGTELNYNSDVAGKEENGTYYPQYTVNEDSNAKKDLDVTAIITSKTDEDIIQVTVGEKTVALTDENKSPETANELGWYYPDTTNKKVIAKLYKFDTYNNKNDNGKVKEIVAVTGSKGGSSIEIPSIEWTFRRINKSQVKNANGTTTVTITYNLPVDKDSIPEGWNPVYDSDNVTIHAITRTFAKGEKYDKDVIVSQNGNTNKKVTTNVKVGQDKSDNLGPQAGTFSLAFVIIIAGVVALSISRYRRMKK